MAISRFKTSSVAQGLPKYQKLWDQSTMYAPPSYESIATYRVGAGGASSIILSSIPSTYTHLQVRLYLQTNRTGSNGDNIRLQINDDTGGSGNYTRHQLTTNGSSVTSGASVGDTPLFINPTVSSNEESALYYSAHIIDILDYSNSNKKKTIKTFGGWNAYDSGSTALYSGLYNVTTNISKLEFLPQSGTQWNQYSVVALYGIRG